VRGHTRPRQRTVPYAARFGTIGDEALDVGDEYRVQLRTGIWSGFEHATEAPPLAFRADLVKSSALGSDSFATAGFSARREAA
jgi:hypothetical protein